MPANFLHGVETVELTKGTTTVRTVKTAIIGLVGTAPINDVDAEYKSINEPILITKEEDATLYFGKHKVGFTIPQALKAIFDQGAGTIIVVNVFDPSVHESPEDVELKDIVGSVETLTGKRTGLRAFEDSYSLFGFYPKTIIAPVYSEDQVIVDEINKVCKKIRAIGIVDAPVGTTVQDAIKGRGTSKINFNINSDRVVLCYPHIKVYDYDAQEIRLEPLSQRLAGVIAVKDNEKGYHWSPSNTVIQGVLGTEKNLTSMINDPQSEVNLLNEAGILTVFNSYGTGFRTWGNRSSAYPSSSLATNFINIRRVADILHESVEYAMLDYIDCPIDEGLIDSVCETVNQYIRNLIGRGALIDGKCSFNSDKNSADEIAKGHLIFDIEFMPPTPCERITFESFVNTELLKALVE